MHPTRTKLRREALMSLLLNFITNATDIIDFFGYVDEERIFEDTRIVAVIVAFFSLSVLQFSFTLSAKMDGLDEGLDRPVSTVVKEAVFATEMWSVLMIFLTQDFPFCIIRTLIVFNFGTEKNYLLYFFVVKNYVLVAFEIYLVANLILDERHRRKYIKKRLYSQKSNVQLTSL